MANWDNHPTVLAMQGRGLAKTTKLSADELRRVCLEAGADDVGFVALDRSELDEERERILWLFSGTRTLISLVCRMNREPVRSPARSAANQEFHTTGHEVNEVARKIVKELDRLGVRAMNPPMAFPMEMDGFPGKIWSLSLKPLAVAAGLGRIGIHRNVIHPRFGNFILLGAVLIDAEVEQQGAELDYNPCLGCKLCVAACPVGAISPEGDFNFSSCYTHNYREFMGGFTNWVETVVESRSAVDYRSRVSDGESASMWQSLSYGANYKAAYCLSVCPAGEEVIAPFLHDRPGFLREIVKPLQAKVETIYVQPHSDAEEYVARRFPHKRSKRVGSVLRPSSVAGFVSSVVHVFQPGRSRGLEATYHFCFTGEETLDCTIRISQGKIVVTAGLVGNCDLLVRADSKAWLRFLRKEMGVPRLLLTRKLRLRGNPRLLVAFGQCFS